MQGVHVPWKSWVAVCDGANALFFRNDGDAELLNLRPLETLREPTPATHELGTDRPGRSFQSFGVGRSAVECPDRHAALEEAFLKRVAAHLHAHRQAGAFTDLILVAPPRALGVLRDCLSDDVRGSLTAELAKDLTHLPTDAIERHLKAEAAQPL